MSSIMDQFAACNTLSYSMSKAAITQMGKNLARELAGHKINVNVIRPGWIDTEGEHKLSEQADFDLGEEVIPRGMGRADDVAEVAVFLASDGARYITGMAGGGRGGLH